MTQMLTQNTNTPSLECTCTLNYTPNKKRQPAKRATKQRPKHTRPSEILIPNWKRSPLHTFRQCQGKQWNTRTKKAPLIDVSRDPSLFATWTGSEQMLNILPQIALQPFDPISRRFSQEGPRQFESLELKEASHKLWHLLHVVAEKTPPLRLEAIQPGHKEARLVLKPFLKLNRLR